MIVSLNDVLKDNVVFQFNFHNLEFLKAILEVHYEENYPLILGISESGLNYMGEDFVFRSYFKTHKTGFSSVMIDGLNLDLEFQLKEKLDSLKVLIILQIQKKQRNLLN